MQETMIDYKQNIYQELSRLTKGLGSEKRLDILNKLSQGPKIVEGIAHATGLSVANTSHHLQVLKESHLVVTSRNGNCIRYKEKTIIVYCRGRQCGYANLAAQDLQSLGYSIYSLNRSFADWKWGSSSRSELD